MPDPSPGRVAILYPGDRPMRQAATPENNRLATVFQALARRGIPAEPAVYHPPTKSAFQALKRRVETEWVPAMQRKLDITTADLPILWDCDFLLGPRDASGRDTHVLCEINVSSVAPYPESAPPYMAEAVLARLQAVRSKRSPTAAGTPGRTA